MFVITLYNITTADISSGLIYVSAVDGTIAVDITKRSLICIAVCDGSAHVVYVSAIDDSITVYIADIQFQVTKGNVRSIST